MRKPDFHGTFADAWKLDFAKCGLEGDGSIAAVAIYVLHADSSHPIWPWYRLVLMHLRHVDGMGPPVIYLPGATHEIVLEALNPSSYVVAPNVEDKVPCDLLSPVNFAAQLIMPDDDAAIRFVEKHGVYGVVNGALNPDTDGFSGWVRVFGDNMVRKV